MLKYLKRICYAFCAHRFQYMRLSFELLGVVAEELCSNRLWVCPGQQLSER